MTAEVAPTRWRVLQVLPIVEQLRGYQSAWLRGDLVAGVVVAALIIPKNLGYAEIAGVPLRERPVRRRCRDDPLRAVRELPPDLHGSQLGARGGRRRARSWRPRLTDPSDVATLVAGITLTSGLFFLALAVFRMGWLSQFLSRAVVTGFLFGAAIDVVIGELPKLTGTDSEGSNSFQELWSWLSTLDEAHRRHGGGGGRGARRRLRPPVGRSAGPRRPGPAGGRPRRGGGARPRPHATWPWSGTSPAGCRRSTCPTSGCWWTMPARCWSPPSRS